MEHQRSHRSPWRAVRWLSVAIAILTITAFGGGVTAVHAAAKAQLSSCASVTTSPATAGTWNFGELDLTLTGQSCGQTYHVHIDQSGNVSFPSTMMADTYTLSGTFTVGCAFFSLTCTIANGSTFTIEDTGGYSINAFINCLGVFNFRYSGAFPPPGGGGGDPPPPTATPELTSSELVAVGFVPAVGILVYWRRRKTVTLDSAGEERQDEQGNQ